MKEKFGDSFGAGHGIVQEESYLGEVVPARRNMRLFESKEEKAERLSEENVYIGVKINAFEYIDFRTELVDYFSDKYYVDDNASDGEEEYIKERLSNLTEKDVAEFFQYYYGSKSEMIEHIMDKYLDENDFHIEICLDEEEEECEDFDDEEEDAEDLGKDCANDSESKGIIDKFMDEMDADPDSFSEESSDAASMPLDAITSKMKEVA